MRREIILENDSYRTDYKITEMRGRLEEILIRDYRAEIWTVAGY